MKLDPVAAGRVLAALKAHAREYPRCVPVPLDPEEHCPACEGKGTRAFLDPDSGWHFEHCLECDGVSTAGYFVLEVVHAGLRCQYTWQTIDFRKAIRRGEWVARMARGRFSRYAVTAELLVVWKWSADVAIPATEPCEEVVARRLIWNGDSVRAA